MLKVEVQGLGNQNVYKVSTEKEVYYDSYMVPMDIPEVESVPNSTDCLVTLKARNEGNASGKVMMNLTNQVYGSTDEKDIKEYQHESEEMTTPGAEATITYLMKETLMNEDVYSTVEVWTGEGHDQGTEAPMSYPVTIKADDVASENGDAEKPDTPDTPDNPDDSEEDDKPENPFIGFVKVIKQVMQEVVKVMKKVFGFWGKLFK